MLSLLILALCSLSAASSFLQDFELAVRGIHPYPSSTGCIGVPLTFTPAFNMSLNLDPSFVGDIHITDPATIVGLKPILGGTISGPLMNGTIKGGYGSGTILEGDATNWGKTDDGLEFLINQRGRGNQIPGPDGKLVLLAWLSLNVGGKYSPLSTSFFVQIATIDGDGFNAEVFLLNAAPGQ